MGCAVDRFGEPGRGGREAAFSLGSVAVELQMREMNGQTIERRDRFERGLDVARKSQIVAMEVKRVRDAEFPHRLPQRAHDLARGHAVSGHDVVEPEAAHVVLEGHGATGIDDLDAERARGSERRADVIADEARPLLVAHRGEQEIVISEHGKNRLVDDRRVGELEMGMERGMRRDRGFDDRGESHRRIEPSGSRCRPAEFRERCPGGSSQVRAMLLGQQQARRVHIGAGDMRVDVDRARHDDLAGKLDGLRGAAPRRRRYDAAVVDP